MENGIRQYILTERLLGLKNDEKDKRFQPRHIGTSSTRPSVTREFECAQQAAPRAI